MELHLNEGCGWDRTFAHIPLPLGANEHFALGRTSASAGVVALRIGLGPLALDAPCRVVSTVEEPFRRGFTYGTLPGRPESGEESFTLEHHEDRITFTISAFSRPNTALARAAGPLGRTLQRWMTGRYLRTMGWTRLAAGGQRLA